MRKAFILLCLAVVLIACESTQDISIVVESRQWRWERAIEYKDEDYTCLLQPDGGLNCQWDTDIEERCNAVSEGTALPPIAPVLECELQANEWIADNVIYQIRFHKSDAEKSKEAKIDPLLWDLLEPGFVGTVRFSNRMITEILRNKKIP